MTTENTKAKLENQTAVQLQLESENDYMNIMYLFYYSFLSRAHDL